MKKILLLMILIMLASASAYKQILYGDYNPALFIKYIDVPLVAVSQDEKTGLVGTLRIAFLDGNGDKIVFDSRTNVDTTTIESALNSISFAESYLNESHDYFISYDLASDKVSGGSAGSTIAAAIIALSENKSIENNTILTGAIDYDGNLIETGGIPMKAIASAKAGYNTLIIPPNSSQYTVYEKHIDGSSVYYMTKQLDMIKYAKENYNLDMVECLNLRDCLVNFLI